MYMDWNTVKLLKRMKTPNKELAQRLAREELSLHRQLIQRRESSNMTRQDVADRLGVKEAWVRNFESLYSNPTLSEIRYYALVIGVYIEYHVKYQEER